MLPNKALQLPRPCRALMSCGSVWHSNLGAPHAVSQRAVQLSADPLGGGMRASAAYLPSSHAREPWSTFPSAERASAALLSSA